MIQGCLIRIVDDDEDMRESLSFLLESEGWQCAAYASAREFLIEDAGSVPGCLILDIRMPEMTGLELQQEMNRRKIFLPIVFLTGHGSIDMAVSAMKSGAVEFLQKPVDHARLLGARLRPTLPQRICGFGLRYYRGKKTLGDAHRKRTAGVDVNCSRSFKQRSCRAPRELGADY